MEITPPSGLTGNTGSEGATRQLAENFDNFLTLLTTQLENQDPLSPMDSTEFTNQVVQFSALEQQIAGNNKLDDLIAAGHTAQSAAAVSYLGKTVEVEENAAILEQDQATIAYELPAGVAETSVTIFDKDGSVVRTLDGGTATGRNNLTWNGEDGQGVTHPGGMYTILVVAKDGAGNIIDGVTTLLTGKASEIVSINGEAQLKIGDAVVPLDRVRSVQEPA